MTALAAVPQPGDPLARPGTVPVEGCHHCGDAKREHCQRWHPDAGWHGWSRRMTDLTPVDRAPTTRDITT